MVITDKNTFKKKELTLKLAQIGWILKLFDRVLGSEFYLGCLTLRKSRCTSLTMIYISQLTDLEIFCRLCGIYLFVSRWLAVAI